MTGFRMHRAALLFLLAAAPCAASFAAAPVSHADGSEADKAAIAQLEQRWLAAIATGDRSALNTILADDYRDINWAGQVRGKAELIADPDVPANTTRVITHLEVRVWGDTAVATGINQVHSSDKGWTVEVPFTDVFARIDGQWRAVSSQETMRRPGQR